MSPGLHARLCPPACGSIYAMGLCRTHYHEARRRANGAKPREAGGPMEHVWTTPVSAALDEQVRAVVGPRALSAFIREAVREKLAREPKRSP